MTEETTELAAIDQAAEELQVLLADANLAASRSDPQDPMGWVIEWYMSQLVQLDAAEAAIKEHVALLLNQIAARRKTLRWRWGLDFRLQCENRLRGEKRAKSFLTPFGRIGHRTAGGKPQAVVDNEQLAIDNAELHCPGAVKKSLKVSELLAYAQKAGEPLEGTHIETPEKKQVFFAGHTTFDDAMIEAKDTPLLPQETEQ